jgi:hypothetical protein
LARRARSGRRCSAGRALAALLGAPRPLAPAPLPVAPLSDE